MKIYFHYENGTFGPDHTERISVKEGGSMTAADALTKFVSRYNKEHGAGGMSAEAMAMFDGKGKYIDKSVLISSVVQDKGDVYVKHSEKEGGGNKDPRPSKQMQTTKPKVAAARTPKLPTNVAPTVDTSSVVAVQKKSSVVDYLNPDNLMECERSTHKSSNFPERYPAYRDDNSARTWLLRLGYDMKKKCNIEEHPLMKTAYAQGEFEVCKWLCDNAELVVNNVGASPMHVACMCGYLSICRWLFKNGSAQDVSKADTFGDTPMLIACQNGHLSVCKWLFEVGASRDISKTNKIGYSPMYWAYKNNYEPICHWLVINGALNQRTSAGNIDRDIVKRDLSTEHWPTKYVHQREIHPLQLWAREVQENHRIFFGTFLRASVVLPACQRHTRSLGVCHLPCLPRQVLESVGEFLGVIAGQGLRNVREMDAVMESIASLEKKVRSSRLNIYEEEADLARRRENRVLVLVFVLGIFMICGFSRWLEASVIVAVGFILVQEFLSFLRYTLGVR